MTATEFDEWMALDRIDPCITEYRDDLRMAILAQVMAAPYSKHTPKIEDFMPKFREPKKQQTPEQIAYALQVWTAALGGNG